MLSNICLMPLHTAPQSPLMMPVTTWMMPWITPMTVFTVLLMLSQMAVNTEEISPHAPSHAAWMTGMTAPMIVWMTCMPACTMGAICSQALVTFATMASQRPANSVWNSWNLLTSGVMTLAITQSARGWTAAFTASHTPIQKLRNSSEVFQRYRNAATSAPMSVMTMPMGFSFMVPLSSLVALSTRAVAAARAFSATVTASE